MRVAAPADDIAVAVATNAAATGLACCGVKGVRSIPMFLTL